MHPYKFIYLLFFILLSNIVVVGQADSTKSILSPQERESLLKLKNSKQIMMASLGAYTSKPAFINTAFNASSYKSFWYHDSYFLIGYGQGKFAVPSPYFGNRKDTISFSDFSLGLNFAINKLSVGRRLWDISGVMLTPSIGACYNSMSIGQYNVSGLKIIPAVSLQLPYFAIDARLNMDIRGKKSPYVKSFALYPEVGIRIDGLYNILDPFMVNNGHYEGTRNYQTVSYREESSVTRNLDGSMNIKETTYKITTQHEEHYNFDSYARSVGPFVAIGPRVSLSNKYYCGSTRMFGLGFHARMPMFGVDFFAETGKLGFASSYKYKETINDPKPNGNKINKDDYRFTGTYTASRVGARVGVDLMEILMRMMYKGHDSNAGTVATKFTRVLGGFGGGYALLSKPQFDKAYVSAYKDSLLNTDYTLLTSPINDSRFAENTPYFTWFVSAEVGAVQLSFEWYRYKYAPLANCQTITLGYMLPYKRLIKRYKNLRTLKKALRN